MELNSQIIFYLLLTGLAVGTISGMLGIGGAVIIIPVLMFVFHFPQQRANGTSIAMLLPPIGIFAVISYQRAGNVDWRVAMLMATGFALGAYLGGRLVNTGKIPDDKLRALFAIMLLYVAGRMIFQTNRYVHAAVQVAGLMATFGATYLCMRLLARKWSKAPYWPALYQDRAKVPAEHDYEI